MSPKPWVRLSTQWWSDDLDVSLAARGLFSMMLSYCGDRLTDGRVSERALALLTVGESDASVTRYVTELVACDILLRTDNGVQIVGWSRWQETKADVVAKREQAAERQREYRDRRRNRRNKPDGDASVTRDKPVTNASRDALVTRLDTDTDTDTEEIQHSCASDDAHRGPSFAAYWVAYPNKKGKARAQRTWRSLSAENRELAIARLGQYVASVRDPQYLKHGDTYLSQRTWLDFDPLPEASLEDDEAAMRRRNDEALARWEAANAKDRIG